MTYQHGETLLKPKRLAMTADQVRAELANLRRIQAQIQAETAAKEAELARIRAARKRLQPVSTWKPSPEALAYREQYGHIIAAQPPPKYGGRAGLRAATEEAKGRDPRKTQRGKT